ncbi:hypothetical protein PR202_gb14545 [Eleusine coracana subsp. coracana]|uniref:Pectinesterase inhibitor domain-containing protein n=1 Tax=Eleusine coracana subsp. coracana TaxID=191504 RepID=A0AAV5EVL5_ELECO|nr:hypothetical protein PR202_gb14545 [Eleusine coracana subsp. coracana]
MNRLFFPLAILVLLAAASTSTASVLQDTCKSIAASHRDIGYDYCLSFFQADKGSAAADKRGLAAIAVRIAGAAARNTAGHIASLKRSTKDKSVAQGLADCAEVYSSAVSDSRQAAQGIASGNVGDAVALLSAVLNAPDTCDQGFEDLKVSSPLAADDDAFRKEATIALFTTSALSK